MAENKTAKTPTDSGVGFIDGVWYGPGPTAWQCQCGKPYTVTCISSKPAKREWVGLTDEERHGIREWQEIQKELGPVWAPMMLYLYLAIEAKLKEKNHG